MKKNLILITGIGISILFLLFIITSVQIGMGVRNKCKLAQAIYSQNDCVDNLSLFLDDDSQTFRVRNSAIWALGQLGNSKALPILQKYYTGNIPKREPYDDGISQHELKKAINLSQGNFNITALVWRNKLFK
jgi:PBS lyase HEAT-like repeat